jgi:hypothetical protein
LFLSLNCKVTKNILYSDIFYYKNGAKCDKDWFYGELLCFFGVGLLLWGAGAYCILAGGLRVG